MCGVCIVWCVCGLWYVCVVCVFVCVCVSGVWCLFVRGVFVFVLCDFLLFVQFSTKIKKILLGHAQMKS